MESAIMAEVKQAIKNDPDWVERFCSKRLKVLCAINRDILQEQVSQVDDEGYLREKMVIPRKYLNRYALIKSCEHTGE